MAIFCVLLLYPCLLYFYVHYLRPFSSQYYFKVVLALEQNSSISLVNCPKNINQNKHRTNNVIGFCIAISTSKSSLKQSFIHVYLNRHGFFSCICTSNRKLDSVWRSVLSFLKQYIFYQKKVGRGEIYRESFWKSPTLSQ